MAEARATTTELKNGTRYCRALVYRYTYHASDVLTELDKVRSDLKWGEKATQLLIETYLDPDLVGPALCDQEHSEEVCVCVMMIMLQRAAQALRLLDSLMKRPKTVKHIVCESLALALTKNKDDINKAVSMLTTLLEVIITSEHVTHRRRRTQYQHCPPWPVYSTS